MRRWFYGIAVCAALALPIVAQAPEPTVTLEVDPDEATVGDPLEVVLTVQLPPETALEPAVIGPQLGPFAVTSGSWDGPLEEGGLTRWVWTGTLAAFKTGELEIPPVHVTIEAGEGRHQLVTEPRTVTIVSVIEDDPNDPQALELADLKPPASLEPDYEPVWTALGILALLLAGALVIWWLQRRYGARLAAAEVPTDPFHRTPPHVWVYAELQKLLERRLPERGDVDRFYAELSRILKLYLGGRYRVALMEETTDEVPDSLVQAGAPERAIGAIDELLRDCDRVKFAREVPGPEAWKAAVERVYRIVDTTKPVEAPETASRGAA